jgi:hypothetical protein
MRLSLFPKYAAQNSEPVLQALIQGFIYHGYTIDIDSFDSDAVVIWSQLWAGRMKGNREVYEKYRNQSKPVIVVDAGCIHRNHTWRIITDQCNQIAGVGHDQSRRQQLGLEIDLWRYKRGSDILIALQRTDSNQWRDMPDVNTWLTSVIDDIRQYSDRNIRIRPHPRNRYIQKHTGASIESPQHLIGTYDDYDFLRSLDQAWCVINWNSSPGIVSTLRGVPAFVSESSLAAPVANHDMALIENPLMPDRTQWVNDLAWTEWTLTEMQQGIPQSYLISLMQRQ